MVCFTSTHGKQKIVAEVEHGTLYHKVDPRQRRCDVHNVEGGIFDSENY